MKYGCLKKGPALTSLLALLMKGAAGLTPAGGVTGEEAAEARAAAAPEEAVRLTRPRLAETLARGKHLEANLRLMGEGLAREEVKLAEGEAGTAGYPAGTRLFRVFAPNAYSLLLVRQGGALKIVHAGLPRD